MIKINLADFPSDEDLKQFHWTPIIFQPILESPESLVVGVAVVSASEFVVKPANQLDKLSCLFGKAEGIFQKSIIEECLVELQEDIAQGGIDALSQCDVSFQNVCLRRLELAQGFSAEQIADSFLAALSSLHSLNSLASPSAVIERGVSTSSVDRLPWLVHDQLRVAKPEIANRFAADIIQHKQRRARGEAHKIRIDYEGKKIAANFGTLQSHTFAQSVGFIKHRLWDLKVDRDTQRAFGGLLEHELFVYHLPFDDPTMHESQASLLQEAVENLEKQADTVEVRFRPFDSVDAIASKIVELETR